ncbi:trypsin-like serine protease [Kitasatospora sp. NPDC059327]|uniref:trypsin-like serine protease n=1 Tax=Kitasatospora sp. NPDC059327 TaxID=3346803 RepID=UPI003698DE8D
MLRKTSPRARVTSLLAAALAACALSTVAAAPAGAVAADPATDGSHTFTAKLTIGDTFRACTGALVDRNWIITAASCFADDPAQPQNLQAGAPKWRTTATIGRTDLTTGAGRTVDIVSLVPRQDRDLVMARLAAPVDSVTPLKLAATAPTSGQSLRIPAYGRTKTEWVPNKLHTGTFTLDAVRPTAVDTTGTNGAAVCKGDTGAPVLRETNGRPELVAVASRSWQGGCLGVPATETRTGASSARTDDIVAWVDKTRRTTPSGSVLSGSPFTIADPADKHLVTFVQDNVNHLWSVDPKGEGWRDLGAYAAGSPTAVVNPNDGHIVVYVNGPNNRLWSYDLQADRWTRFTTTPSGTVLAPTAVPRTVVDPVDGHFVTYIRDTNSHLWSVDPSDEGWRDLGAIAAADPAPVVNPNDGHIVVFVNGPNNRLNSIDERGAGRTVFTTTSSGTVMAFDAVPSTVVNPANGHFTTYIRDTNNHLWSVDPLGAGWLDHGAKAATDPIASINPLNNRIVVVVHVNGPDNYLNSFEPQGPGDGWTQYDRTPDNTVMAPDTKPHTVEDPTDRHLVTYIRDTNNTLWAVDPADEGWTRL